MATSKIESPGLFGRGAKRPRLGEVLVGLGYLKPSQVDGAIAQQRQWGVSFGRVTIARGLCTEQQVLEALSRQLGFAAVDLDRVPINPRAAELLTAEAASRLRALPFQIEGTRDEVVDVAFAAPAALDVQDEVRALTSKARVRAFLASDEAVERAIGRVYRHERSQQPMDAGYEPAGVGAQVEARPAEQLGVELSASTLAVIRQAAADNGVTAEVVVSRVLDAWAAPFVRR
jgi:hypothetical protein